MATGPGDGHGRYEKILIDAPSMEHLFKAQEKIKEKYGKWFFDGMANDYEEPYLNDLVWQALIDTNYPVNRLCEKEDINDWENCESLQQVLEMDKNPCVGLEFVMDAFVWLLNAFGAEIKVLEEEEKIPMICNWTCHGFKTVGYGCFY